MATDIEKFKLSRPGLIPISLWNEFVDLVHSALIKSFVGGAFARTPMGTQLYTLGGDGGMVNVAHPWKCTLFPQTNQDGSPAGNKVGVEYNSSLFTSLIPLEQFSGITGLYAPGLYDPNEIEPEPFLLDLDGPDDTTGYNSPDGQPDDYVFLEIKFREEEPFDIESVSVETNGNGSTIDVSYDPWDDSGDALVANNQAVPPDPLLQTYARIVLATYVDGQLQQNVSGNLVMVDMAINGQPARYPVQY